MLLLLPIILLLLSLLGIAVAEFYALATNHQPYTHYGRLLIARYPGPSIGLAFFGVGFVGWLSAHLFSCH